MEQGLLFDHTPPNKKSVVDLPKLHHHTNSVVLKDDLFTYLLQQKKPVDGKEKTYILVHSNLLANHLKHCLGSQGLPDYPLYFITFFDLAKMILSTLEIDMIKPVLNKSLSLFKLHELCHDFFNYDVPNSDLGFLNNKPAFINSLLTSYAYLDKHAISDWPNQHEDLLALHKKYQADFYDHYYTQDSFLNYVSSCLEKKLPCNIPHTLLVYGFYDFSPVQYHLLSKTTFIKKSLWLLTDSPAHQSFAHTSSKTLKQENLHSDARPSIPVHACQNEKDELDTLKTLLIKRLNNDLKQLNTIAVLPPNQHYLDLCKNLFKHHHIPFYCPIGDTIQQTNLGKILSLLIEYKQSKQDHNDIVKLLLDFPGKEENLNKKSVLFLLQKNRIFNQSLLLQSPIEEFSYVKLLLQNILDLFEKSTSYRDFFELLLAFLNHFVDEVCVSQQLEHASLFDLKQHLYTLEKVNSKFTFSSLLFGLEQFLSLNRSVESGKKMHESGVYLAPIDYAAFFNFDHIYILGLNQHAFPKPDQLLNLLTIEKYNLDRPPIVPHLEKDLAIFKQLLMACPKVDLFYSLHDQLKDQALQQSVIFDYIQTHSTDQKKTDNHYSSVIDYQKNQLSSDLQGIPENQIETFAQHSSCLPQQIKWMRSHLNPQPQFDALSGNLNISDKKRDTFSVTALQRYATCPYQYFLHDVLDLRNNTWPQDIYGLHPMEKGELLHQILFLFYQRCLKQNKVTLEQKTNWLKEIFETFQSQPKKQTLKKPQLWPLEQLNLYQKIKNFIAHEHMHHNHFYPLALEMRFGSFKSDYEDQHYSNDEALCLSYQNKKLYFRGKIDRIDIDQAQQHLHIIDYKSGKLSAKNNDFAEGKNIQMAIYLLLCQKRFGHIPLKNMHARMVSIDPKQNFNEKHLSGEYLEQHLDDFYQLIFSLSQRIDQGIFFQQPGNNAQHCQFCDYQIICQSNVVKRAQLIQKDPELISILENT